MSPAKHPTNHQTMKERVHSISSLQFLQQGVTTNEWNDFYKYLLVPVDNISAVSILDWWCDYESVHLATAFVTHCFLSIAPNVVMP